jgi:argininosuccinate lyase
MAGFVMTLEGLLSTYNKSPQEDLESLSDTIDDVTASLQIAEGVMVTMEVCPISLLSLPLNDMVVAVGSW